MHMLQLNPSLPVEVVNRGTAECVGWFDYGKEDDLMWLCILDSTGEAWLVPNKDIRGIKNYSIGRNLAGDRRDVSPDNALRTENSEGEIITSRKGLVLRRDLK